MSGRGVQAKNGGKVAAIQPGGTLTECIERLVQTTAVLRSPEGCPWDRKQTHGSLRAALVEECYEVIEAIDSGDPDHLREELGDLLLHVLLHSQIASETSNGFCFEDVARDLHAKLIRRHPHVFGDATAHDAESVVAVWEQVKRKEKAERTSAVDGIPPGMPALLRAEKAGKKAARVGFDWPSAHDVLAKVREELDELERAIDSGDTAAVSEEIGDLLLSVASLARHEGVEAELLLHQATDKFLRRFRAMEARLAQAGQTISEASLDEMEAAWQAVKQGDAVPSPNANRGGL